MSPLLKFLKLKLPSHVVSSKTNSNVDNKGTKTSHNSFRTKPKQESLKSNIRGNIEETNTGGCGIDPAYSRGRRGKRELRRETAREAKSCGGGEEEEDRRTDTYTSRASLRGTSQIMESASRLRLVYTPLTPSADVLSAKTSMGCAPSALAQLRRLSPICFSDETADTLS